MLCSGAHTSCLQGVAHAVDSPKPKMTRHVHFCSSRTATLPCCTSGILVSKSQVFAVIVQPQLNIIYGICCITVNLALGHMQPGLPLTQVLEMVFVVCLQETCQRWQPCVWLSRGFPHTKSSSQAASVKTPHSSYAGLEQGHSAKGIHKQRCSCCNHKGA